MSQNPPDQPELPKLPDFPSGDPDPDPVPADPPAADPDPQPFEPVPEPLDPAIPGAPIAETGTPPTPPTPPPPGVDDSDGGAGAGGSAGGSKLPLLLGGLAALLLVGGGIWWLANRDSGGSSPDEVVRDYLEATQDGDCDKLISLVTEEMWSFGGEIDRKESLERCEDEVGSSEDMDLKITKVETTSEKGDKATVEAEVELGDRPATLPIDLRKVDGKWLINEM